MAQAVIRLMEDRDVYEGTSTEPHKKLEAVAEEIGVSITRDKAWPKSARWLWRRIHEVVPLLVASGIEAGRAEEKRGTVIALRKSPTDNATDTTGSENATGKPDTSGNTASSDATANAIDGPDAIPNPADRAECGNSGIRSGDFSGPAPFAAEPGEDVLVTELEARRRMISSEEERRVRNLEREGLSTAEARASVIGYPEACTDGGRRIGDA